jgi:hypothetical protein
MSFELLRVPRNDPTTREYYQAGAPGEGARLPAAPQRRDRQRVSAASVWARIGLAAVGLSALVSLLSMSSRIDLVVRLQRGETLEFGESLGASGLILLGAFLYFVSIIFSSVTFSAWTYHAHRTLAALGVGDLRYSSSRAASSYFVPLVNLVRPFLVLLEIARASAAATRRSTQEHANVFVAVLWVSWVVGALAGTGLLYALMFIEDYTIGYERELWYLKMIMVADGLVLVACVMAWVVIQEVARDQNTAFTRLQAPPAHDS